MNGWGNCSHCGRDVRANKNGLAWRHGYIRVKHGYRRANMPKLKSGRDHHACAGSGKLVKNHYLPSASSGDN